MDERPERRQQFRPARIIILAFLLLIACSLLALKLIEDNSNELTTIFGHDYRAYTSAARVLILRGNPYDRTQIYAMEQTSGFAESQPVMVWNPPWALTILLPFALLPFPVSTMIWLLLNLFLSLACGAALWHELAPYGDRRYWLGMILALAYLPTMQTLRIGQISLWLLVGIVGFLGALRDKRDVLAGAFLVLLTIKPHISFLLLLAIAWWIVRERRWRVLFGGAIALAVTCGVVGFISPAVFGQYLHPTAGSLLYWRSTTLGTWLLIAFGNKQYWLQYLPSVVGILLFVGWALRHKGTWDWSQLLPGLLLGSTIFAAYGWSFDQVILLPVVVTLIARMRPLSTIQCILVSSLYVLTQLGLLVQNQLNVDSAYYYWHSLALAGLYTWQQAMIRLIPHQSINEVTEHG